MHIIETEKSITLFFKEFHTTDSIVIPIFSDINDHPIINDIYLIYVYLISLDKSYVIPINTDDCININVEDIKNILTQISNNTTIKYVLDRKDILHIYHKNNLEIDDKFYDIKVLSYISTGEFDSRALNLTNTAAHNFIYYNFYKFKNLNSCIPIYKHIEKLEMIKDYMMSFINKNKTNTHLESFKKINTLMLDVLFNLESSGIKVDDNFSRKDLVVDGYVYPEYNIYTATNRPSCNHRGYNFISLSKNDPDRTSFISRFNNGILILFDYSSYHLYLIADIIGEKFETNPHLELAKIYLNKKEITEEEYKQCKEITFNVLYGNIPSEFKYIPFFKKTDNLIKELWNSFNSDGYIFTRFFKRKIYKSKFKDMTANKLFNYYLQSLETENNMIILNKLIKYMKENQLKSKIILYIYDSILVDYNLEDGRDAINDIINILEQDKKFPITIKYGKNYSNLTKIL